MAVVDTARCLDALHWEARKAFLKLGKLFRAETGLDLRVRTQKGTPCIGGRRTCATQNAIYAGGGGATHAYGCQSWHVMGRAVDADPIVPSTGNQTGTGPYAVAGAIWEQLGGKWGGNFPGFADIGHFEWHPGVPIEQACPVPAECEQTTLAIITKAPMSAWALGIGAFALVGAALWYRGRFKK